MNLVKRALVALTFLAVPMALAVTASGAERAPARTSCCCGDSCRCADCSCADGNCDGCCKGTCNMG